MEIYRLADKEYAFASIVWENEPISSGTLVKLCEDKLNWKKSTTYTVLKKLCNQGILKNDNSMVSSIIKQHEVQKYESEQFIDKTFGGSMPKFINAFFSDKKITEKEAAEIKDLIDKYVEE